MSGRVTDNSPCLWIQMGITGLNLTIIEISIIMKDVVYLF
jgi:hypothetical protein